ncbi:hypothetical protein CH380_11380 [Leptospira adleri]|uniref:Uncharacterized protein n=1 Tax=Leptospira adleri TaxID=2023186 RepID=A0A2M9YNC0_9LEPT|nr:hypothetical protein CH380_11380 [Leptospira adleri]PJZ62573.1 hypothetical protein CH376_07160 [Leptospira adleri]
MKKKRLLKSFSVNKNRSSNGFVQIRFERSHSNRTSIQMAVSILDKNLSQNWDRTLQLDLSDKIK